MRWPHSITPEEIEPLLLQQSKDDRFLRLFAVFCVKHIEHLLIDSRSIDALVAATLFADGKTSVQELQASYRMSIAAVSRFEDTGDTKFYNAALAASWTVVDTDYSPTSYAASHALYYAYVAGGPDELKFQEETLLKGIPL